MSDPWRAAKERRSRRALTREQGGTPAGIDARPTLRFHRTMRQRPPRPPRRVLDVLEGFALRGEMDHFDEIAGAFLSAATSLDVVAELQHRLRRLRDAGAPSHQLVDVLRELDKLGALQSWRDVESSRCIGSMAGVRQTHCGC